MEIRINGGSDDLVEVYVDGHGDEHNAEDLTLQVISNDGGQVQVRMSLQPTGVWAAQVSQINEDIPVPDDWDIRVIQCPDADYSVQVAITTPGPARLQEVANHG